MPRPRRKDRIELQYDRRGFGLVRHGVLYTEIAGRRLSTGLLAKADGSIDLKTKKKFLAILEQRIREQYEPHKALSLVKSEKTILEALSEYVPLYRKRVSEATVRHFKSAVNNYIVTDFPVSMVDDIHKMLIDRMKELHDHNNNYIIRQLAFLENFFQYCVDYHGMPKNPINAFMYPQKEETDREAMSVETFETLCQELSASNDVALVRLCNFIRLAGCRIEECLRIQWKDIDYNEIRIHGKGSRDRIIPLELIPELRIFINEQKDYSSGEWFFHWRSYAKIQHRVRTALRKHNLHKDGMNFHSIRKLAEHEMRTVRMLPDSVVVHIIGHNISTAVSSYFKKLSASEIIELARFRKM